MSLNKINFRDFKAIVTNFEQSTEGQEYDACTYILGESKVIYRKAHITPNKAGQFVTLWIRNDVGVIRPYDVSDDFDIVIIYVKTKKHRGLFIFNKTVLNNHDIISGHSKIGKRAMRVYTPWDKVTSLQAIKTQMWQLEYFTTLN
jgi:hypothetical protein